MKTWISLWCMILIFTLVLPIHAQDKSDDRPATKADIEQLSQRIDRLDQKVENLRVYVDEMDKRLSGLMAAVNTRIDDTNSKIDFVLTMLTIFFGGSLAGFLIWLFQTVKIRREAMEGLTPRQREEILELVRSVVKTS